MIRAVLLLAALGLAVAAPAAAAGPELGGRVAAQHIPIVWEVDRHSFEVTNQSTIPVRVSLEIDGDPAPVGWYVDSEAFELAVDESRTVTITAAGTEPATIAATLTGIGVNGIDAASLRFEVAVRHATWWETHTWWPWAALAALLIILLGLRLRRRT